MTGVNRIHQNASILNFSRSREKVFLLLFFSYAMLAGPEGSGCTARPPQKYSAMVHPSHGCFGSNAWPCGVCAVCARARVWGGDACCEWVGCVRALARERRLWARGACLPGKVLTVRSRGLSDIPAPAMCPCCAHDVPVLCPCRAGGDRALCVQARGVQHGELPPGGAGKTPPLGMTWEPIGGCTPLPVGCAL